MLSAIQRMAGKDVTVSGVLGTHTVSVGEIAICDAIQPDEAVLNSDMLILITTKAFDVEKALQPFVGCPRSLSVLLMQNGVGSVDIARAVLGNDISIFSSTMMIGRARHAATEASVLGCAGRPTRARAGRRCDYV